jgi:hypothetical protein
MNSREVMKASYRNVNKFFLLCPPTEGVNIKIKNIHGVELATVASLFARSGYLLFSLILRLFTKEIKRT